MTNYCFAGFCVLTFYFEFLYFSRTLADLNSDGKMDKKEFSMAMHLIKKKLQGYELPKSLPASLKADPSLVVNTFSMAPQMAPAMTQQMTMGMGMPVGMYYECDLFNIILNSQNHMVLKDIFQLNYIVLFLCVGFFFCFFFSPWKHS